MNYYGLQAGFWNELIIIMGIVIIMLIGIPALLRGMMGADKMRWFSYNHINKLHKIGDWTLRFIFVIVIIIDASMFSAKAPTILILLCLFIVCQLCFQAYVEWKYSGNRVNYKVSLIEVGLTIVTFFGVLWWLSSNSLLH
ncbi:DUF4181 domain-containing protein [Lentibacillus sp. N15]|uniref:DUF4181 domain-containing protein n=1 Tax=Lentibacillus songyuanensis TaxID=3136161 RepID=UPI0031BB28CE